jgi:hypothetical protein
MPLFLRVTLIIAAAFVALLVAAFLLKIVLLAAVLAALGLGGLFLFNFAKTFVRLRRERATSISSR